MKKRSDGVERIGGKKVLQLRDDLTIEPLALPTAPEVNWEALFDAFKCTPDERKAIEMSLETSLTEAAERLKWTNARFRNTLTRARRRLTKGNLGVRRDEFVKISAASRRSLNPAYESRSKTGISTWNLAPLTENDFASVMRDEFLQVIQTKASVSELPLCREQNS